MKRYYVEMYSKSKFIANCDYDSLDDCVWLLDEYTDKLKITDTKSNKEFVMKKGKTK